MALPIGFDREYCWPSGAQVRAWSCPRTPSLLYGTQLRIPSTLGGQSTPNGLKGISDA